MITELSIKNFKSIKELKIDCRRINLLIGEPNTGKSNILEALGLLSWCGHGNESPKEYVRFQGMHNLFYDNSLDELIKIDVVEPDIVIHMRVSFEDEEFLLDADYGQVALDFSGFVHVHKHSNMHGSAIYQR